MSARAGGGAVGLAVRSYGWSVRLLPSRFRARFGAESIAAFAAMAEQAWRRGGAWSVAGVWLRSVVDVMVSAVRERLPVSGGRRRGAGLGQRGPERSGGRGGWVHEVDARAALRSLRRRPGMAAVVVVTLAVATGFTAGIFAIVDGVLLRPLPYASADRLYRFVTTYSGELRDGYVSYPDFEDLRAGASVLEAAALYQDWRPSLTEGEPTREPGLLVSEEFFRVFGLVPALGRAFLPEEQIDGRDAVVVLGHGFWQSRYGGDPAVLGRSIEIGGRPHMIVGVGPARFPGVLPAVGEIALIRPFGFGGVPAEDLPGRGNESYKAAARLRTGVPVARAQAELDAIAAAIARRHPESNEAQGVALRPLQAFAGESAREPLLLLLAGVALVLAIAVVNVTNLLLGRAAESRREVALRLALGAGRARVLAPALAEAAILSAAGGVLGLGIAALGIRWFLVAGAEVVPLATEVRLDVRVVALAFVVTAGSALVTGLAAGLHAVSRDIRSQLADAGRGGTASPGRVSARGALVVAQVALSMLLLVGAGLLLRSYWKLVRVDPGFDARVATMRVDLPGAFYDSTESIEAFYASLLERVRALPGVRAAGTITGAPMTGARACGTLYAEEDPDRFRGQDRCAELRAISGDYLGVMGIPLLRGRAFGAGDHAASPDVVLISESTANLLWPGRDPIGKRLATGFRDRLHEVVGVVADVRQFTLSDEPPPQTYIPSGQWASSSRTLVVRASVAASALFPALRAAVAGVDARVPVSQARTMAEHVDRTLATPRFRTALLASFAGVALLLSLVGIYGVIAYSVTQRRREMAIRRSVGARSASLLRLVVGQGMRLALLGVALGAAGSLALTRLLRRFLFGVSAGDPAVFATVPVLVLAIAAAASILPAARAARIDPMRVLREE